MNPFKIWRETNDRRKEMMFSELISMGPKEVEQSQFQRLQQENENLRRELSEMKELAKYREGYIDGFEEALNRFALMKKM